MEGFPVKNQSWEEYFRGRYKNDWLFRLLNNWVIFGYAEDLHVFTCICRKCRKYWGNCACDLPPIEKKETAKT